MTLKYFMPDWDDRIDPGFNFVTDEFTPNRDIKTNDVFAHEVFKVVPYDGLLVSRGVVEKSESRNDIITQNGIHKYFRVSDQFPIMGDCGAFSYVDDVRPRYETTDVLDYYAKIGVNFGVAVDHLIFNTMTPYQRRRRQGITLENAKDFIEGHRAKNYTYSPMAASQGWSPVSYAESTQKLLEMGYRYIALGGLARSTGKEILSVLKEVHKAITDFKVTQDITHIDLHLFGVAKIDYIRDFVALGVTSIDSASHLRKAWLRSGQNYWTLSGKWYTAIRVPQSTNPKVIEYITHNGRTISKVVKKEQKIKHLLCEYDSREFNKMELRSLLNEIVGYDDYLLRAGDDGQEMRNRTISREKYKKVLSDQPWKECPCEICQDVGVEVIVFRGANRNKRRGYHNTWVFYQQLQSVLQDINSKLQNPK